LAEKAVKADTILTKEQKETILIGLKTANILINIPEINKFLLLEGDSKEFKLDLPRRNYLDMY
jgi:hypothetical protein